MYIHICQILTCFFERTKRRVPISIHIRKSVRGEKDLRYDMIIGFSIIYKNMQERRVFFFFSFLLLLGWLHQVFTVVSPPLAPLHLYQACMRDGGGAVSLINKPFVQVHLHIITAIQYNPRIRPQRCLGFC